MKHYIAGLLATLSLVQNSAHADFLDLPDPGDFDTTKEQVQVAPVAAPSAPSQYVGSIGISAISRKSGGTLYKVSLQQALGLLRLDFRVTNSQLKIHQAIVITESGQRVDIRGFRNTATLVAGTVSSSENLNLNERVSSIEILVEAQGVEADLMLTAISDQGVPKLILRAEAVRSEQRAGFSVGEAVLSGPANDGKYYAGKVVEILAGGKAKILDDDDGKIYTRDLSIVGKRISCESTKGICQKSAVISGPYSDGRYFYGSVIDVYTNGIRIIDDDDDKIYIRNSKIVHASVRCDSVGNCVGNSVMSGPVQGKYYTGKIIGIYSNGLLSIRDDDDGKLYLREKGIVISSVRCDEKSRVCVKDQVLSGPFQNNFYTGIVEGIYSNGFIYIRDSDDGKLYIRKASEVVKRIRCEGTKGICINDSVFSQSLRDRSYYKGQVLGVYSSGILEIQDEDDGKIYFRNISQVHKSGK